MADRDSTLWNEDRAALHKLIEEIDPALAGLYRQAIFIMDAPPIPGDEKARLSLVSHCIRELMNNLPDYLGDVRDFPASRGGDENKARSGLIDTVEKFKGVPLDELAEETHSSNQPDRVTVPADLLDAAVNLAGVLKIGKIRGERRDSAAVLGYVDRYDPALKPWRAARQFFMSFAHLDRLNSTGSGCRDLPTDEQVKSHIEKIEASMRVRLGAFFDNMNEVRGLADQAYTSGLDGFEAPSDQEVHTVLARLGSLQLRRAFYPQLENPHWVAALAEQGAFLNPPSTELMPDGTVRSDPWPEIDYIVRMTSLASSEVAKVLEPIADSTNQWVRRGILEAATLLAPEDAACLVPKMKEWPGDKLANFRINPKDIAQVVVNLLGSSESAKGRQLANAYFEPRPPAEASDFGHPEPVTGIESYWYSESLTTVALSLGGNRVRALEGWLKEYQKNSNSFKGEPNYDLSHIWRPDIRLSAEHHIYYIGDALVDALRAGLADEIQQSIDSLARFLLDDQPLLSRIAIDVLAEAIEQLDDKSAEHASKLSAYETALADQASVVLANEMFTEHNYRAEYFPFIRACLS